MLLAEFETRAVNCCTCNVCPVIYVQSNLSGPLHMEAIDSSSGLLIPFLDPDTNVIYVAGKVLY